VKTGWNFTEDFQIEFEDMLSNHTWLGILWWGWLIVQGSWEPYFHALRMQKIIEKDTSISHHPSVAVC